MMMTFNLYPNWLEIVLNTGSDIDFTHRKL